MLTPLSKAMNSVMQRATLGIKDDALTTDVMCRTLTKVASLFSFDIAPTPYAMCIPR